MRRREFIGIAGGAAAWPFAVRAQQKPVPIVGYLSSSSPRAGALLLAGFRQGLRDAGFVEGRSVAIEYRWAEGDYERFAGVAHFAVIQEFRRSRCWFPIDSETGDVASDVHSEKPRHYNHNNHDPNDIENIH